MAKDQTEHQEAVETVKDLIKGIEVAMLTTVSDNKLVSRPMNTQEVEFDGELWFLTKRDSSKYQEIKRNPSVNLAYAGKSYVSISGTAEFEEDQAKKKEYWNPILAKVLEASYDDPDVVLIKVIPETAEYWESGKKLKTVKEFAKKTISNKTLGDNNKLSNTVDFDKN